jgi:hypothetical protein
VTLTPGKPGSGIVFVPHPEHDPTSFTTLAALVAKVESAGYYGGVRLLMVGPWLGAGAGAGARGPGAGAGAGAGAGRTAAGTRAQKGSRSASPSAASAQQAGDGRLCVERLPV